MDEVDRPDLESGGGLQAGVQRRRSAASAAAEGREGRGAAAAPITPTRVTSWQPNSILSVDNGAHGGGGRRAGSYSSRGQQDARHHRRSAARRRVVRGAPAEGPCGDRRDRRAGRIRQGLQEQAPGHRKERRDRRGDRIPDPEGQARLGAGRRLRAARRSAGRWAARAARHPEGAGCRGAVGLPGEPDPGRLPAARREDQR